MNKGLDTFQLLLLERRGDNRRVAATVMDPQATSMGTRVTVRELITLLQLTAAPSSSNPSSSTPTSDFMNAVSASLSVVSFMPSSPSSSAAAAGAAVPLSHAVKTKGASVAKDGRTSAQTVFPLVDNTTTTTTTSASSSTPSTARPPPPPCLKLVGSVHRRDVFLYLQTLFAQADNNGATTTTQGGRGRGLGGRGTDVSSSVPGQGQGHGQSVGRLSLALQSMLPEDASEEEERTRRADRCPTTPLTV